MSVETFKRVREVVEPVLVHYQHDLRKLDFKTLMDYDGPFVYGYRRTGTDLLLLRPSVEDYSWKHPITVDEMETKLKELFVWIDCKDRNTHFLHFDGHKLHSKTVHELRNIWFDHVAKIVIDAKNRVLNTSSADRQTQFS
ncbi:hypothetical protein [Puia dinghuensis]|uniref:Uncharacterized protein n=1 Tax=Puia dinghuensis TaxID=1792502 RepID=A0A8J2UBA2_9BACT|nr:hypothetical protein [Puia dinghuensis]GGA92621.1 hypothetical protein GCM10011511_15000 [Puia dinghuensis]